jgi:hypothetical protein
MRKILGSPVTAVVSIIMLGWGGVEFYQYVIVPHARRLTGGA